MKLKARLRSGELLAGYLATIPSSLAAQAMASAGADWLLIDQEHGAVGPESLHAMIAVTAGTSCAPIVRVPKRDEAWVRPALDLGAEGICFPFVRTPEDAKECVSLLRYPPNGRRGWGPLAAHARWTVPLSDYMRSHRDDIVCVLLVECAEAIENIEAICGVDGVDCLLIAPYDLSTDLGCPGDFHAAAFREAVRHVEETVLAAGLPLGGVALDRGRASDLRGRGYRLILLGIDLLLLGDAVRAGRSWLS